MTEEIVESSKAVQEASKAVQSVAGLVGQVGRFLGKLIGPAAEQFGGLLGDQFKSFRAANLIRLNDLWEEKLKQRSVNEETLKLLPFGTSYRVLEAVSMEEDESVQEIWAELLASASDPNRKIEVKKIYIDILKSISSAEVALLNILWETEKKQFFKTVQELTDFELAIKELAEKTWRQLSTSDRNTAVQNLVRLRCITFRPSPPYIGNLFGTVDRSFGSTTRGFALVNMIEFGKVLTYYEELVFVAAGIKENKLNAPVKLQNPRGLHIGKRNIEIPEMNYMLTAAGKDLMSACKEIGPVEASAVSEQSV